MKLGYTQRTSLFEIYSGLIWLSSTCALPRGPWHLPPWECVWANKGVFISLTQMSSAAPIGFFGRVKIPQNYQENELQTFHLVAQSLEVNWCTWVGMMSFAFSTPSFSLFLHFQGHNPCQSNQLKNLAYIGECLLHLTDRNRQGS